MTTNREYTISTRKVKCTYRWTWSGVDLLQTSWTVAGLSVRCPECKVIEAVNASIMMNLHVLVLVIYTALRGLYKTAYAVLLTKQHNNFIRTSAYALCCIMRFSKNSLCGISVKTA